jgi:orotidine-5'-phosphate decarboxylase
MDKIIKLDRSIIPACDVTDITTYRKLVKAVYGIEGIEALKVGLALALKYGIPRIAEETRAEGDLEIIYDHQKAATDIPDMGKVFAEVMKSSKVNAAILFPQAGPATEEEWIKELQLVGVGVIVGGEMTHPEYLDPEGGYIVETAPEMMYRLAVRKGVRHFVVPGNKPEKVAKYRGIIQDACGDDDFVLMAPGFVKQKGKIEDTAKAAGNCWHAIVGSGIYDPKKTGHPETVSEEEMHSAAKALAETIGGA